MSGTNKKLVEADIAMAKPLKLAKRRFLTKIN